MEEREHIECLVGVQAFVRYFALTEHRIHFHEACHHVEAFFITTF